MFKLLVCLTILSILLLSTSAGGVCEVGTAAVSGTCSVTSAIAGIVGVAVCVGSAGIGCAAIAVGGAVAALCGAISGSVQCGGGGGPVSPDQQIQIISYLEGIQDDVVVLGDKVDFGFYENKYNTYINKIISATSRYQHDVVEKTIKDNKKASYETSTLIREWVDDTLGDGAYDVQGALNILEGMISGRQGITRSPSVYQLAMDQNICTEDLLNYVTNLIIEGTTTAFIAMNMRGDGVHQADIDRLLERLKDNLKAFKSGCSKYQVPHFLDYTTISYDGSQWGEWTEMEICPNGGYATSFKLKVEGNVGNGDDTALNAICLVCNTGDEVCSREGGWGSWGKLAKNEGEEETCKEGFFASDFKFEADQGDGDDSAGNDLRLYCKDKEETSFTTGNGGDWGNWMGRRVCPDDRVICGLKTKVEPYQGTHGDDSALNGVQFLCCEDIWS